MRVSYTPVPLSAKVEHEQRQSRVFGLNQFGKAKLIITVAGQRRILTGLPPFVTIQGMVILYLKLYQLIRY